MIFNQTNNNYGDVNNKIAENRTETNSTVHTGDVNTAISQNGSVAQGVGGENKVQVTQPKDTFWTQLWNKITGLWTGRVS